MEVFPFIRSLYSLDTLDTRLTTSSLVPIRSVSDESSDKSASERGLETDVANLPQGVSPSKWRTPEFYFYYAVFVLVVPQMFKSVMEVSSPSHPSHAKFAHLLSGGWILGRKVDNSDSQYSSFRDNIPYMAIAVLIHSSLRRLYNAAFPISRPDDDSGPLATAEVGRHEDILSIDSRFHQRTSFDLYFGLIFLFVLHGFSALKILLILYINFKIATKLQKEYVPTMTWMFNIGILFLIEFCRGYQYLSLATTLFPFSSSAHSWGRFLDKYGGLIPRWEILFNFTILRLISFNMDYYWSLDSSRSLNPVEKKRIPITSLSERERVTLPSHPQAYLRYSTYLSYTLYSPLYLAGPILTFNDYVCQARLASPSLSYKRTLLYAIRFLLVLLCMEFILHYIYTVAICNASPDWHIYTPFQISMLSYFNLHIVWLKLLIPFRFFRLWALLDAVDPPENVVRCMSDNYSTLAFWRGWHRSFNRWIVRYIYVPIGGGAGNGASRFRGILNTLAVFTFVALWHDINLRLLTWGWLVTLFILPEIIATMAFPARRWKDRPKLYRVICGIGAVGNILMMMAASLVGFAVGVDGLKGMVAAIVATWSGLAFLACACATLFVGVQVMFEVRESEKRKGMNLKF